MNSYLIIRTETEAEYKKYSYIFGQFNINVILWLPNASVSEIVGELFENVKKYSDWQLFVIDLKEVYYGQNPYACKQNTELVNFSQQVYWLKGKGQCKPPQKIYLICQRRSGVISGIESELLYGFERAVPSCRFLVMNCSGREYLESYEKFKMISLIIILADRDMPHNLFEAYHVYGIDLKINEKLLFQYLENEKEKVRRREEELYKKEREIKKINKRVEDGYQEFIPPLSTCGYDSFNIKTIFCGIKTNKSMRKWLKKKVETERRIDELKKEQIRKQKELQNEMKERMEQISTKSLPLDDDTVEEIEKKIPEMQNELNKYYVELWKLDQELMEEKYEREKKLDKALENRFTVRELMAVGIFVLCWTLGVFSIFLIVEDKILKILGMMENADRVKWWCSNLRYESFVLGVFVLFFGIIVLIDTSYNLKKMAVSLNEVFSQIRGHLQKNLFKYRDLFSLIYRIKIYQGYLNQNKEFRKEQSELMKELKTLREQWEKDYKSFQCLYKSFEYLKEQKWEEESRFGKRKKEKIVLDNNGREINNPLFYVEGISIAKEVRNES